VNQPPVFTTAPTITNALAILKGKGIVAGKTVVLAGNPVGFTAAATDPDGDSLTCLWDFGDGSTSADCQPVHVFTDCTQHTVTVSVSDGSLAVSSNLDLVVACPLTISRLQLTVNLQKLGADACSLTAQVVSNGVFAPVAGAGFFVDIGGAQQLFELNNKLHGVTPNGTCAFTYDTKAKLWRLTVTFTKGTWQGVWKNLGIINGTVSQPVNVPVTIFKGPIYNGQALGAIRALTYKAIVNKTGTAK